MQINISGHHVEVTQALNEYVKDKFEKLERHADGISSIQVILSIEKLAQKAEATILIKGGKIFANADSEDMYAAIDSLSDKLDRQLLKYKDKTQRKRA
ncbi:MAG: ribosome-associated translation inhibitor RaiA [Pseudomonadales bacterium]|nr:ribosome-associated translation inhibitor RaiA [Pseudomonadales bacterium]